MVIVACGGGVEERARTTTPRATSETPSSAPTSAFALRTDEELAAMSDRVRFRTDDGVHIEGRVFGEGNVGVVLAHMGDGDQTQWWGMAGTLADEGYRVLTYNRRGSCPGGDAGCSDDGDDSRGWRDLVASVEFLRGEGSSQVVIGGASQGAMEALYVGEEGLAQVDGVIWVAGGNLYKGVDLLRGVRNVREPKLFLAGEFDGSLGDFSAELHRMASPPKELVLLDTGEHGTDILAWEEPDVTDAFRRVILDFLNTI